VLADLALAARFLTRVPVPAPAREPSALAAALAWAPLVGAGVGALAGLVAVASGALGLPPLAGGVLAVAAGVVVTGGLHEDGLADSADALGARARPLAVLRDSATGSYGVMALVLALAARAAAVAALPGWTALAGLVAAHALGRGVLAPGLLARAARGDGLRRLAGTPSAAAVLGAPVLGLAVAVAALGAGGAVLAAGVAWTLGLGPVAWARRRLGGITGDILGAGEQLAETAAILVAAAWLA